MNKKSLMIFALTLLAGVGSACAEDISPAYIPQLDASGLSGAMISTQEIMKPAFEVTSSLRALAPSNGNLGLLDQVGEFNEGSVVQSGSGNIGLIRQIGASNTASIQQFGAGHAAMVSQQGRGNVAMIVQR
ncbi:MAG: hypothetical protein INR68_00240 [Methylobacterium mesophilicum]|nr:hypothetical protein [Methylobacterium mesophilicum]